MPSKDERTKVRRLADKLEREVEEEQPDEDDVEDSVERAARFVSNAGGLMKATAAVMNAIQKLRGNG